VEAQVVDGLYKNIKCIVLLVCFWQVAVHDPCQSLHYGSVVLEWGIFSAE